jgi:hypothetical protein
MAHFAQINDENIVTQVIVADQNFINSGAVGDPAKWIQTSYNTRAGVHLDSQGNPDNQPALRKNFAGIGFSYDATRDAFIPPKPFASWVLDEESCLWEAPVPRPQEGFFTWNENKLSWDPITPLPT